MGDWDEIELHVECRGEGLPLLFLHGFAGSARNFRPQIRVFAERMRCISFDARGHARSAVPEAPSAYSPSRLVGDARWILRTHGSGPAVLCGLSMGASVALAMASADSRGLRGLILASIPGAGDHPNGITHRAHAFSDAILHEGLEKAGERFVWGPDSGLDERGRMFVRQGFLEHDPKGLAYLLRYTLTELPTWSRERSLLEKIELPTLVIAGGADPPAIRAGERVAEFLPRAQFVCIEGAGHVVNLANPHAFNEVVSAFLDDLDSSSASSSASRKPQSSSP